MKKLFNNINWNPKECLEKKQKLYLEISKEKRKN